LFPPIFSRFLLNIPAEEAVLDRIVFQIEQAYWFYLDNFRAANLDLKEYNLRTFSSINILFHAAPLLLLLLLLLHFFSSPLLNPRGFLNSPLFSTVPALPDPQAPCQEC